MADNVTRSDALMFYASLGTSEGRASIASRMLSVTREEWLARQDADAAFSEEILPRIMEALK